MAVAKTEAVLATARSVGTWGAPAPSSLWVARGLSSPRVWLQAQWPVLLHLGPTGLGAGGRGAEPSGTAPGRLGAAVPPACPSPLFPASPSFPRCFPPRLVAPLGRGWGKSPNLPSNCFSSDKAETVTVLPLGRPWRSGRRGP